MLPGLTRRTAASTTSRRTRAGSFVALLLLAVSVAACGSAAHRDAASSTVGAQPASHVLRQPALILRERFALLRTRPEGLPPRLRGLVRPSDPTFNPALAQRIPVLLPGDYWLTPAGGQLCVVSEVPGTPGAGTVCGSIRDAIAEGVATVSLKPAERSPSGVPSRLIVGVAPDGTRAVRVHTRWSVATVPVTGGVFVLRDAMTVPSDSLQLVRARGR